MNKFLLLVLIVISAVSLSAQSVGINADESTPNSSAMLDVKSTSKGFLAPRMTDVQKNAISNPATGLLIYQTDGTTGYYYYNGTSWLILSSSQLSQGKIFIGNASGNATEQTVSGDVTILENGVTTIGTAKVTNEMLSGSITNDKLANPNQWTTSGTDVYYNSGDVGIGTSEPEATLDVNGDIDFNTFKADYSTTYTIDAGYPDGSWFNAIPTGTLTSSGTYIISIRYNTLNSWGPPYYLNAATTITTTFCNGSDTGNEIDLSSSSHVGSSSYYISVRNRMGSGFVSSGLDVQLNGFSPRSGDTIVVTAKRIF